VRLRDTALHRWATGDGHFETRRVLISEVLTDKALTDAAESVRRSEISSCNFIAHIFRMSYFITKLHFLIEITPFFQSGIFKSVTQIKIGDKE
jgi:hypothetical protein